MAIIGKNAADLGRRQKNIIRTFLGEKSRHRVTIGQIEFGAATQEELAKSLGPQSAKKRRADQSTMAGDENFAVLFHLSAPSAHLKLTQADVMTGIAQSLFLARQFQVMVGHHLDQGVETDGRAPAEIGARLASVAL